MATRTRQTPRRRQVLTRERIVETAVELLDEAGKDALTVRALTGRLATGPGAIYWHIGNMDELLEAATDAVVATALNGEASGGAPRDEIRAVALGLFDAVTAHPWLAAQLATQLIRNPWGPVTVRIFESIGRLVTTLGVPQGEWFATTSTLVHYILGATAQTAQTPQSETGLPGSEGERAEFLDTAFRAWQDLDPGDYPFIRAVAGQMREHDDREQFLTGIDLVLTGITTRYPPST